MEPEPEPDEEGVPDEDPLEPEELGVPEEPEVWSTLDKASTSARTGSKTLAISVLLFLFPLINVPDCTVQNKILILILIYVSENVQ